MDNSSSQWMTLLINAGPFLFLIGFWIYLYDAPYARWPGRVFEVFNEARRCF